MVLNGNHGRVDYRRPVNYNDSKKQSITCYFHVYSEVTRDDSIVCEMYKSPLPPALHEFPFCDIISHTNMSITEDGMLIMPEEELKLKLLFQRDCSLDKPMSDAQGRL